MKLIYKGPKGHRRINGVQLQPGQIVDAQGESTISYFLGLRLNDGSPEFVRANGEGEEIKSDAADDTDEV